jgi:hypothetical protein
MDLLSLENGQAAMMQNFKLLRRDFDASMTTRMNILTNSKYEVKEAMLMD